MPDHTTLSGSVIVLLPVTSVALIQLLPEPVEEKVHGLAPCAEVRVSFGPWLHVIVAPVGRLLIVNDEPEEQTKVEPEIDGGLAVLIVVIPELFGFSQLLRRVAFVPPQVAFLN